ncbi:MAG: tRNA (adenosine(37)-N6)-dimethylallyltransferase MiaA [Actinomycetaceae bacterium]|nr:tRNA (adenosine(37)-N6)-dimethylallyltransferase MiaA [Actinomycetaceae bacterium]
MADAPSFPIVAIVGPTGSGKTALSIELALAMGGPEVAEIVSADAMQLYRGMDIGTAKIPVSERRAISHHQIDVLDVTQEASVAAYQRHARADVAGIGGRGKTPIVVGGSGLYVAGLLDRLDFPGRSARIRLELEDRQRREGIGPLLAELRHRDPQAYATIDHSNTRRVIRALEVIRLTGRPFTTRLPRHTSFYPNVRFIGVDRDRALLAEAIDARARGMFASGLVEETRALLDQGLAEGPTASRATGYAQAMAVIEGRMSEGEAVRSVCAATRKLAKKQRTWFRADPRISWIDLSGGNVRDAALDLLRAIGRDIGI